MIDESVHPAEAARSLADRLKSHTWPLHREAERSGIIQDLLRGRANRDAYALLLGSLVPVYDALERGLTRLAGSPLLRDFARPEIYRTAALRADLDRLAGTVTVLPGALRYAERIDAAARGDGALLIAHAYVRYMGDLNGGQILKRILAKTLDLGPDCLTFYDFPALADPQAFAGQYRTAIDRAEASITDVEAILDEASIAFRLNIEVSNEVRAAAGRSCSSAPTAELLSDA